MRLVWVVDPENRTVTAYRPQRVGVRRGDDELSGEEVTEELRIPLRELWPADRARQAVVTPGGSQVAG